MVIFLGRDCHFLGRIGNSITCDEMVIFLRRDFHFIRTSWRFHNLGRVGHVLWTRWSPFNKFGKLKILRGMHFVIIGGMGSNYWGDINPPSLPALAPLAMTNQTIKIGSPEEHRHTNRGR